MASRYLLLDQCNPIEASVGGFERWWATTVQETVANVEGFVAAQRYRLGDVQREWSPPSQWKCLTIYELEGDDAGAILRAQDGARASGVLPSADGLLAADRVEHVYVPVAKSVRPPAWGGRADARFILIVRSNPDTTDEIFDEYYDRHLWEIVTNIDGYVGAQRYWLNPWQRAETPPAQWRHISIYESDTDDLSKVHASQAVAKQAAVFSPWQGILAPDHAGQVFSPVAERISKAGSKTSG